MRDGSGLYWYHNDHLGTPQRMTAADSGAVAWSAGYAAFGQATIDPLSSIDNNLRFPGQYYDAESGLHYNYNRYYNPNTGRYLTTDPFKDGLNLYLYTFGNPINLYDPLGLASICDLHNALDLLGMVPGFGEIFDLANSLLYLLQGDYGMAALSAGAAIPVAGYLFNAIKGGKKLGRLFRYLKRFNAELGEAGHVVLRHGDDVVHGNSRFSQKAQHVYEIRNNKTGQVVKTGISQGKISKKGKSYRAERQRRKWGKEDFDTTIIAEVPAGPGARQRALDIEAANAHGLRPENLINPDYHVRP